MSQQAIQWDPLFWQEGAIEWRRVWGEGHFSIGCGLVAPHFYSGQFTQIGIAINEQKVVRPLSLVNIAGTSYEFYLSQRLNGLFSNALAQADIGSRIWINRSCQGSLRLQDLNQCRHLYLISTGTGLSPYLSFLREGRLARICDKIFLCHGVRTPAQLAYAQELATHSSRYFPKMSSILAISDPASWQALDLQKKNDLLWYAAKVPSFQAIYAGRISECLYAGTLDALCNERLFDPLEDAIFICGNTAMVRELQQWFSSQKGFQRQTPQGTGRLFVEGY